MMSLDQGLGAEADGEPHDARAGQQGRDVDAELPEHREHRERQDDHLSGAAHQRHDRAEAGASLSALALELPLVLPVEPQGRALDRDLPIGHESRASSHRP